MSLRRLVLRTLPLALALFSLPTPSSAHAAPAADAIVSTCTLDAFDTAFNGVYNNGGGTITFACSGTIVFISQKVIEESITIDGTGQDVTLSGGNATRLFLIDAPGVLDLRHLTLSNGAGIDAGGPGAGGAVTVSTGLLKLSNVTLRNNVAPNGGGGAVFLNSNAKAEIEYSVFHNNRSLGGGAIYNNSGATLKITDSHLYSNTTDGPYGGAIQNLGVLAANDTLFTGNTALVDYSPQGAEGGGALYNDAGGVATLLYVTMSTNEGRNLGGAVWNKGSLTVEGGRFTENGSISVDGGAIAHDVGAGLLTIDRVRFAGNHGDVGGAIWAKAPVTIRDSDFDTNGIAGTTWGGAINLGDLADGSLLERVTLRNNLGNRGGGLYAHFVTVTVRNSTISQNHIYSAANLAAIGGGILANVSSLTLRNVTLYGNTAEGEGVGGLSFFDNPDGVLQLDIVNTIVAGNTPRDCELWRSDALFKPPAPYSIAGDASCGFTGAGAKNSTNPLLGPLADNGSVTFTHLPAANSPAVDCGTNIDCPSPDQRGTVRPIGAACDVGSVEYDPTLAQTVVYLPAIKK